MTEPLSPPPAAPPPRVRWLRVVAFATLVSLTGFAAMVFAQLGRRNYELILLLVLVTGPLVALAWSYERMRRVSTDAARAEFRRHWTRVWLGAIGATVLTIILLRNWRGDLAAAVRWPALLLLVWTSLLMLACWRLYRVLLNRKLWARAAFAASVLATLLALFYAEENWRGRRAWERFRVEWEAKGARFTYAEVLPPPVPDEQNLALHPLFKPVLDYKVGEQGWAVWRDTNGMKRLDSFTPYPITLRESARKAGITHPLFPMNFGVQNRTSGVVLADFTQWQAFYRLDTNFASEPLPANPAADVLRYLRRHETNFALLDEALARPHCQFPIHLTTSEPGRILLPHLANVRTVTLLLVLRAAAHLELGQSDEALRDFERAMRMCAALEREPFVMCQLVQISIQACTLGAVAQGCAKHQWEDRHLRRIEELLLPVNKSQTLAFSLHTEAAGHAEAWSKLRANRTSAERLVTDMARATGPGDEPVLKVTPEFGRFVMRYAPAGWFFRALVHEQALLLDAATSTATDAERRRVHWQQQPKTPEPPWFYLAWPLRSPHNAYVKTAAKCARLQTNLDHARLAVALERHWLRHRAYPERLDALVPEFLDRIPHDLFDGQPMRYRREGGQCFVLWSIGFDGKDDNAGPLLTKPSGTTNVGEETGDLVWRYPQSK